MLGGYAVGVIGLKATFMSVGAVFAAMLVGARFVLCETHPVSGRHNADSGDKEGQGGVAPLSGFRALMGCPEIYAVMAFNAANRLVMGTAKLTLLPLLLVHHLGLGSAAVGSVFSLFSAFALLSAQPTAAFADARGHKVGAIPAVLIVILFNVHREIHR
jgi:hypothetical protein